MTRRVFTNAETAHVWAQGEQDNGRSNNGQFYFDGAALYSYGSHYLAGFRMPDGVVLINADSYSLTTRRHINHALFATRHLTRYLVPGLNALLDALDFAAWKHGDKRRKAESVELLGIFHARRRVDDWIKERLVSHRVGFGWSAGAEISDDALRYILGMVGLTRSFDRVRRQITAGKEAARLAGIQDREDVLRDLAIKWGGKRSGISDADFDRYINRALAGDKAEGVHGYSWRAELTKSDQRHHAELTLTAWRKDALRAQKWAKGRPGFIKAHATIQKRRKVMTDHLARLERGAERARAWQSIRGCVTTLRRAWPIFDALDTGAPLTADQFDLIEGMARDHANDREAIQQNESPLRFLPTIESMHHQVAALECGRVLVRLARAPFLGTARVSLEAMESRVRAVAAHAADHCRDDSIASFADRVSAFQAALRVIADRRDRDDWLDGATGSRFRYRYFRTATGGAYLRAVKVTRDASGEITGGTLETSQGASVPLLHALRAFQFLKWCRESGNTWRRNGRSLRVGHYQVDAIESDGSFRAGCHRIEWPQVEDLAQRLGVTSLAPDSTVV